MGEGTEPVPSPGGRSEAELLELADRVQAVLREAALDAGRIQGEAVASAEAELERVRRDLDATAEQRVERITELLEHLVDSGRKARHYSLDVADTLDRVVEESRAEWPGRSSANPQAARPAEPSPEEAQAPDEAVALAPEAERPARSRRWLSWLPSPAGVERVAPRPQPERADDASSSGAAAAEPPAAGEGDEPEPVIAEPSSEEQAVRLALRLALEGKSRAQVADRLREELGVGDTDAILGPIFDA